MLFLVLQTIQPVEGVVGLPNTLQPLSVSLILASQSSHLKSEQLYELRFCRSDFFVDGHVRASQQGHVCRSFGHAATL